MKGPAGSKSGELQKFAFLFTKSANDTRLKTYRYGFTHSILHGLNSIGQYRIAHKAYFTIKYLHY